MDEWLVSFYKLLWGPPLLILLLGTGIYLSIALKGMQFRYLGYAIRESFAPSQEGAAGDISQFKALMTCLAGAIGIGSIVGVATAISIGGLGALFWMWVTAAIGMATKYAESLLAVHFRTIDKRGEMIGGPMHYIERGLGWRWMAILFALFGVLAAIGTGNLVQANAIVDAVLQVAPLSPIVLGIILSIITGLVVLGGVRSIGNVASILVPLMALLYLGSGCIVLYVHSERIPEVLMTILSSAFSGQAAFGGFAGASLLLAIQMGVSRSIFSNEAGLGISSIAAAAAKTNSPARQGLITMAGALLSTAIVCTMTGLVIGVSGLFGSVNELGQPISAVVMASKSFEQAFSGGAIVIAIGLVLFAFTTILAWGYYGEKCMEYLFGERSVLPFRILYTLIVIAGAILKLETVWYIADIANGLMVIPNLIALLGLRRVVLSETARFIAEQQASQAQEALQAKPQLNTSV